MNYKEFFTTDNKSGWKCVENKLMLNYPELCKSILEFTDTDELRDLSFKAKVYHFINNLEYVPRCKECDKQIKFGRSITEGYNTYCSLQCSGKSEERKQSSINTFMSKYGVPYCNSEESIEKRNETNLVKYGCENPFGNQDIKNKICETKLRIYGFTSATKNDEIKEKIKNSTIKSIGVPTALILESSKLNSKLYSNKKFREKYYFLNIISSNKSIVTIKCDVCNNPYDIHTGNLHHRVNMNVNPCTICNPISTSSISEGNLRSFVESFGLTIDSNNRMLMGNKQELDIYIKEKNIAIEYNGLFWHSDYKVPDNYHLTKTELCENKGVKLIHIFEDEWIIKQNIVKSNIKNILGLIDYNVSHRYCEIKDVNNEDKDIFLNENNIFGTIDSDINLGLYYDNYLISLMVFNKNNDNYELLRFSNKLNTNVTGGEYKLFDYFIDTYNPEKIISYNDRRWPMDDFYNDLEFKFKRNTKINFYYIVKTPKYYIRESKNKYSKSILVKEGFDKNKTEREIMFERKIYRIYDCGNKIYEWSRD